MVHIALLLRLLVVNYFEIYVLSGLFKSQPSSELGLTASSEVDFHIYFLFLREVN